ncbi:MAG TPA: glycosyltransferase family 2 protein [Casimicrobiaceae bacterium]|nr:glycosyltransferase family 2 protein [Casimicrobiaceae bacterium]
MPADSTATRMMMQDDTSQAPATTQLPPEPVTVTLTARVFEVPVDDGGPKLPASLQISIVTFRPDLRLLERCLRKLVLAIGAAREDGAVRTVALALIDNSGDRSVAKDAIRLAQARFKDSNVQMTFLHGHANIGYGAAHNLVLHGSGADYHLVLNPDVELAPDAIAVGVRWLAEHTDIGAVAPEMFDGDGENQEYTCRRYPSVLDLLLRGFAPRFMRALFRQRLDRYEMRDVVDSDPEREIIDIPSMSGACLLVRRSAIDATGGFDPKFFLYFEDYDWTVRLNRITRTAYLPAMHVRHHGGGAAEKGLRHILWFIKSGVRFYGKHGWKWV